MNLSPPHPDLRACVVVPARNEQALIASSLLALAAQTGIKPYEYEVLLVLDACTDSTAERAREVADAHPLLRLHLLDGPGLGSGYARRAGMDAVCERLTGLGRTEGLIASTDADTIVAHDWLSVQLDAAERGARAIGGRIELGPEPYHKPSSAGTPSEEDPGTRSSWPIQTGSVRRSTGSSAARPSP